MDGHDGSLFSSMRTLLTFDSDFSRTPIKFVALFYSFIYIYIYIFLTMHLRIILIGNQLDAQFFYDFFI